MVDVENKYFYDGDLINWFNLFIKIKSKMTVRQLMFWSFLLSNSTEECVVVGKKDVLLFSETSFVDGWCKK